MKKSKIIAVLVATGVFMAFALGSGSSGSSSKATKVGSVSTSETEKVSDKEEKNKTEEVSEKEEKFENKPELYVGDIMMDGKLKVTYIKSGEYVSDNQFLQPADGNKYVFIELYCENTGDSDASISQFSFDCYADGYAVDQHYSGDDALSATLSKGRTTQGKIIFEVPKDAKEVEFEYNMNVFTSDHVKFIYEGDKDSGFVPEKNTDVSEDVYHKGDVLETDSLRITYLSCGEFESDNMFIQPKDGYKFLYIELEFENISDKDKYVSSYSFDCFADGAACEQSFYTGDDNLDATISAGRKTKGKVVFDIPEDATTVEFEYLDNYWTSGRIVFLYE